MPARASSAVRVAAVLAIVLLLATGAWAARRPILTGAARALTVRDPLRRADALVLLGGDPDSRPDEVARLYRRGLASTVLIVRSRPEPSVRLGVRLDDTDLNILVLHRLGVPASAIRVLRFPGGATSTYDEARAVRDWAYDAHPGTLIVVTSAFHTRRARWLFRRQLERLRIAILMAPVTDPDFDESNWWRTEPGLLAYVEEYLKFLHEWTRD